MEPALRWSAALAVSAVGAVASKRPRGESMRKRHSPFETADGDRANPFSPLSAGTDRSGATCSDRRRELSADHLRYCPACVGVRWGP